jgi:hypothetical protein
MRVGIFDPTIRGAISHPSLIKYDNILELNA